MVEMDNGTLWLGTENGLYYLLPEQNYVQQVESDISSLSHNNIWGLLVDSRDKLWVATARGLDRLLYFDNGVPLFESINKRLGKEDVPFAENLLEDSLGRIWSDDVIIDPSNWHIRSFGKADGVDIGAPWIGAFEKTSNGKLIFGGTDGLFIVNPIELKHWNYTPPLVISSAKVDNQFIDTFGLDKLALPPKTKSLSIRFSSLDYSAPRFNRYAYKLSGYDDDWITTHSSIRLASYTNLDPGNYTLFIKGTNRTGQWSDNLLSIPVEKVPAWHETLLARFTFFVFLLASIFFVYQLRVRQLKEREKALKLLVERKTSQVLLLSEVGKDLTSSLSLEEISGQVYQHLNQVMEAEVFFIGILNFHEREIKVPVAVESGDYLSPFSISLAEQQRPAVWCVNNRAAFISQEYGDWKAYGLPEPTPKIGKMMHSIIYLPLYNRNRVIGCLSVQSSRRKAYSDSHIKTLKTLASYAAIALANASAYKEIKEANIALKNAKDALEEASYTDSLTGLKNRRFLTNYLEADIARSKRDYDNWQDNQLSTLPDESDIVFFLLDLDHFKAVNDTYGHAAGDAVLQEFTGLLEHVFRESDYLIRWGGEEFLVVARFINRHSAASIAERMRKSVESHRFDVGGNTFIQKTCSIGFACFPIFPIESEDLSWIQIVDIADRCLYAAKHTTRNAWVGVYSEIVKKEHVQYDLLLDDIESAIESQELKLETSIKSDLKWS